MYKATLPIARIFAAAKLLAPLATCSGPSLTRPLLLVRRDQKWYIAARLGQRFELLEVPAAARQP